MEYYKKLLYNSIKEVVLLFKPTYLMHINENDTTLVPRFTLKDSDVFDDFPANEPTKFSPELILKAIQWGMILQVDYKGDEDGKMEGHERTIYPMVLGKSEDGKLLIRGYHLNGWSVSRGGNIQKEWRLFRADRILSMSFTGAFFRLAPDGYNPQSDKAMKQILAQANFDKIRTNQQTLLQNDKVDTIDRVILNKIKNIEAKDLNYNLKLFKPWEGNVLQKKDAKNIRITFAKPVIGKGAWVAIVGTSIEPNNIFKLKVENNEVGSFKSVRWIMADELEKMSTIEQQVEFKMYMFLKGN